uniref:Uncharacterized protein n=1 Tax=Arundo donax TaxID=35708 RepID=A0A0A9GX51_ARUDO
MFVIRLTCYYLKRVVKLLHNLLFVFSSLLRVLVIQITC